MLYSLFFTFESGFLPFPVFEMQEMGTRREERKERKEGEFES